MAKVEVIAASDGAFPYINFVPVFIEYWKAISKVATHQYHPTVYLVMESIPINLKEYEENLKLIPPGENHPAFVAQNLRALACLDTKYDAACTSDIDMVPLSPKYFDLITSAAIGEPNQMVVGRDELSNNQYPICYLIASKEIWRAALGNRFSNEDLLDRVNIVRGIFDSSHTYDGVHGGIGWYIDQEFVFSQFQNNLEADQILLLKDSDTSHRRLDRAHHWSLSVPFRMSKILTGEYSDYHLPRPNFVNALIVKIILKRLKNAGH